MIRVLSECVGSISYKKKKTQICACALADAQEDGFFPGYDNDGDYHDNNKDFWKSFKERINYYSENSSKYEKK